MGREISREGSATGVSQGKSVRFSLTSAALLVAFSSSEVFSSSFFVSGAAASADMVAGVWFRRVLR